MMQFCSLASGSGGNSYLVATEHTAILVDAGLSCRELKARMSVIGRGLTDIDAVLLTHEHGDHSDGIQGLVRKYRIPIYSTAGTFNAMGKAKTLDGSDFEGIHGAYGAFLIKELILQSFPVEHDAKEPVGYLISKVDSAESVAIATDLGSIGKAARFLFHGSDVLMLECNYEESMLDACQYDLRTKNRIQANHLSLDQVLAFIREDMSDSVQTLVLGHLSENTITPEIVRLSAQGAIHSRGLKTRLVIAGQTEPTEVITIQNQETAA